MLYVFTSLASFLIGFILGYFTNNFVKRLAYKHKLYGLDSNISIEQFLVVSITIVWFIATFLGIFTGNEVDPALHGIFGSVVGAFFGAKLIKSKK